MILEGICAFGFMSAFLYSMYHLDMSRSTSKKKGIKNESWTLMFWFPILKNVGLLVDFYFLKKAGKYSRYSLVILLSNILVWIFALRSFDVNYKAIFDNLRAGPQDKLLPHKFTGLFVVLIIDNYIQAAGIIYFMYLVYKKERIMDFYRDYFNPFNFCISSSINGFLINMVSQRKSKFTWLSNFALSFIIGGYFLVMYVTYLYKLFKSIGRRRK